ncbi:sulfatase-like hydrolase/transferase [Cyclobacterium jeungdonense]|uniref:Sulfatase-like hydrolase/transferase n=1 Tax=Cyclobacterium jeungdonense TaxID=708087 RepID=A0ABT8CFD6_9BACT|nr:sulfatase-like hydrolase/transferase [Cyclobacterium jeungdonense]MDN3690498.1 sulfatase-like hydrolase/transferase [Cyclobacterium jeungdonense]
MSTLHLPVKAFAVLVFLLLAEEGLAREMPPDRPNVLWITCEDISPYLGSYGFEQAHTPNLDRLAKRSIRYTHAYANAPVCAVARSTILSGMYASTIGTHQMRSNVPLPEEIPVYPKLLRDAGYYCTNNSKKDYNSPYNNDPELWDESSSTAHYRNKMADQPFFAVFNLTVTHESQLSENRIRHYVENNLIPEKPRIDPLDIELPPYHPDLPVIREDWARFHDLITLMDRQVGDLLDELEEAGLADNTVVFFYSDHGGQLSRSKRYIYNVGTQVPLLVHLPDKWKQLSLVPAGAVDESLVSFVDLAPTLLSITGCEIPDRMQGRAFLGDKPEKSPDYVHFIRDRMGERYDFSRAITDGRYYYIRNFMPHRPRGRDSRYGYQVQANWRAYEAAYEEGKTDAIQSQFYLPKPEEQFFDTDADPWQVDNLVRERAYQKTLANLSRRLDRWMVETRDLGLIPEPMFHEFAGENGDYATLYEFAQSKEYPIRKILDAAKLASTPSPENLPQLIGYLQDPNPIIRFWGAYGIFLRKEQGSSLQNHLKKMIREDKLAANRIMAAQALGVRGDPDTAFEAIMKEANATDNGYVLLQALNAFQYSHTDGRLRLDDWQRFKDKEFAKGDPASDLGYPHRIIDDAMALFPDRRKVD